MRHYNNARYLLVSVVLDRVLMMFPVVQYTLPRGLTTRGLGPGAHSHTFAGYATSCSTNTSPGIGPAGASSNGLLLRLAGSCGLAGALSNGLLLRLAGPCGLAGALSNGLLLRLAGPCGLAGASSNGLLLRLAGSCGSCGLAGATEFFQVLCWRPTLRRVSLLSDPIFTISQSI